MKKWLNWVVLVLVFSLACGFLSNWQFNRREAKLAAIALVTENFAKPSVPISDLVKNGDFNVPANNWRSVLVSGHYLVEQSLLVRDRPNNGQPGFEQLVPFQTADFGVIFVSRGWIATGENHDTPDLIPTVSDSEITLDAKVMTAEPQLSRGAPAGQIASINIDLAMKKTSLSSTFKKSYLRMVSESPRASSPIASMPKPSTEEGNNLSYALQWIMFALMAIIALIWRIRKDRELANGGSARNKRPKKSELDAAFEDAVTKGR